MKSIILLLFIGVLTFSCSRSEKNKVKKINHFKTEMNKLNDSSNYYFDIGIKLLNDGIEASIITDSIQSKLIYYQSIIDKKAKEFQKTAEELNLTPNEYDEVFNELNTKFKSSYEKYEYLKINGVTLNSR